MEIIVKEAPVLYSEKTYNSFLPISPFDPQGGEKAKKALEGRFWERQQLATILRDYNQSIGNDEKALEQIDLLRQEGRFCVMTGQQLGLFGGPAYTILKAVSCLLLARDLGAVPIFWLATEDHDVDEIDHAYLLDSIGDLRRFHLSLPKDGRFVEELRLNPSQGEIIRSFFESVGEAELAEQIGQESSYTSAMSKMLAALFKGTGLVFVEPRLLRPLARSFFRKEVQESALILETLHDTTLRLQHEGGKSLLDLEGTTNLFMKTERVYRTKIVRVENGFQVGKEFFSTSQLLDLVEKAPERLSTNAAARCVLQNTLFPVVAYAAGPSELAYYHQLSDYHRFHGIEVPWIVPRISATFITPDGQEMLRKCRLEPWEMIPHHWKEAIPEVEEGFDGLSKEWLQTGVRYFQNDLSIETLARFVRFNAGKLHHKVTLARLKKRGIPAHALHYLRNLLHPHHKQQERVLNWWEFQRHTKQNLIKLLLTQALWKTRGHLYCMINS